jgi:hypothetical protein
MQVKKEGSNQVVNQTDYNCIADFKFFDLCRVADLLGAQGSDVNFSNGWIGVNLCLGSRIRLLYLTIRISLDLRV